MGCRRQELQAQSGVGPQTPTSDFCIPLLKISSILPRSEVPRSDRASGRL